jgi:cobalt-zinc-cadmium resistance protein CzcA
MNKLLSGLISFCLRNRLTVFSSTVILVAWGYFSFVNTPIEAFPDVINTRVVVITQWPGRSAEEVEKFITIPLEIEMNVVPDKTSLRSISVYGLSVVTMIFEDGVDYFTARQMVGNQLQNISLPENADAEVQPPSGPTGEIYRYTLRSADKSVRQLKEIQDWEIDKRLKAVPGVADVISFGGEVKIYEVITNPLQLNQYDLATDDVFKALRENNSNVGADILEIAPQSFIVRGIGLVKSIQDIRQIPIKSVEGTPILISNVAEVVESARPRLGKVGRDDQPDVVEGIVLLRRGENPSEVLELLNEKISELNSRILPEGVTIDPFYDRTTLVNLTTHTVMENLIVGVLLVTFILLVFLADWRTTLIVSIIIPLALLFAFVCLKMMGMSANLLSIGAIDFGIIVDGSVVMVEGMFVYLAHQQSRLGVERFNAISKMSMIAKVSVEMGKPIFFSKLIIITALLPIFAFREVEGKMFSPLAYTIGFALLGALIFTLTLVPVLGHLLLNKNVRERSNPLVSFLERIYKPGLEWCITRKKTALVISGGILFGSLVLGVGLGTEFLPQLNEGSIYVRATMPQSISFSNANLQSEKMRQMVKKYPEARGVISQNGRPNDGTDPTGFFNVELFVDLFPADEWESGLRKEELISKMQSELENAFPGVVFGFSQPISDNVQEAVSGVKGEMAIKVFGDNFAKIEAKADSIKVIMEKIEGVRDLGVFKSLGQPELSINLDHAKMSRYGANMKEAQDIIEMAIGGKTASLVYEGERKFDIRVRYSPEYRNSPDDVAKLLIPCSNGVKIPLSEIADIRLITGTAFVYRENNQRFVPVKFSVRERDLGGTIAEAQEKVNASIPVEKGYSLTWNGEFENQVRATKTLSYVVPISVFMIFILLYVMFGSARDSSIVLLNVPFALIGGILALYLTDINFSISAGVGFIALFGVCIQNGVILVSVFNKNIEQGMSTYQAVVTGAMTRVRPVVMTALMAGLGLLPAALSSGIGSETQRPLAVVVIGGLVSATVLTLLILPVIYLIFVRKDDRRMATSTPH